MTFLYFTVLHQVVLNPLYTCHDEVPLIQGQNISAKQGYIVNFITNKSIYVYTQKEKRERERENSVPDRLLLINRCTATQLLFLEKRIPKMVQFQTSKYKPLIINNIYAPMSNYFSWY